MRTFCSELDRRFGIRGVKLIFAGLLILRVHAQTASKSSDDDPDAKPPATKVDVLIVQRARAILPDPSKWNRADTRDCPASAKTYSIYCALQKATVEITGNFKHRGAAMQEARFVIDEIAPNRSYHHRLMDYNNDPTTTFADIQRVLRLLQERVVTELSENSRPTMQK